MFQNKNSSPRRIALIISISIAIVAFACCLFLKIRINYALLVFIIICIFSFFCIDYFFQKFIFKKLQLVYKFISIEQQKEKNFLYTNQIFNTETLDKVIDDLEDLEKKRNEDVKTIQLNEEFRKEFLMNLAHELKTPIFSIQGYLSTLIDGAIYNKSVNVDFLQNASNAADRLATLVSDLDKIYKYEFKQIQLEQELFSIHELIKEVFLELVPLSKRFNNKMKIKPGCEKDFKVAGDRSRLKQVLINLISNALNYGKNNGETLAGVYEIDKNLILIEIQDDGIGIAPSHVNRVFERFYRTDEARVRTEGGSGLGLAIVKHIVEAHGQRINCRSTLGEGSTFSFTLSRSLN